MLFIADGLFSLDWMPPIQLMHRAITIPSLLLPDMPAHNIMSTSAVPHLGASGSI
jgi:hypothetical protein